MHKSVVAALVAAFSFWGTVVNASPSDDISHAVVTLKTAHQAGQVVSLTDTLGVEGGGVFRWYHNVDFVTSGGVLDKVKAIKATALFPNGHTKTMHSFVIDTMTKNNGYHLVDEVAVSQWVNVLGGNPKYVDVNAAATKTQLSTLPLSSQSWDVLWLPKVVASCGATLDYYESPERYMIVNGDGKTATPTFRITPTPPPAGSLKLDKSTYLQGEKVQIGTVAEIFAAATNWHYEALEVTGSGGFSRFLPLKTEKDGIAPAARGHAFPYWGEKAGALQFVYGGGSANPATPNVYRETAALDTSSLPPGEYEVKYTLFDAVGRPATNSNGTGTKSTKFTLKPRSESTTPVPTVPTTPSTPTAPPSADKVGKVINQQFGTPKPIMLNHQGTVAWKATNNSDKAITTTLTARVETVINQPYAFTYKSGTRRVEIGKDKDGEPLFDYEDVYSTVTRYRVLPMIGTETKTFTIPAKGAVTWDIGKEMVMQIQGGNPGSFVGLGVGGPWVPIGGTIPGSGLPDTKENNNGYVAQSSKVGINDGRMWLPVLTVTAQDAWHYYSPAIKTQIPTVPLDAPVKHDPVVTK